MCICWVPSKCQRLCSCCPCGMSAPPFMNKSSGRGVNSPAQVSDVRGGSKLLHGVLEEWRAKRKLASCSLQSEGVYSLAYSLPQPPLSASPSLDANLSPVFASSSWLLCLSFSCSFFLSGRDWAWPPPRSPKVLSSWQSRFTEALSPRAFPALFSSECLSWDRLGYINGLGRRRLLKICSTRDVSCIP